MADVTSCRSPREELPNRSVGTAIADKKDYIDAVRGWAIILVITCHVGGVFSQMPYPVKKLSNFGWHGVQMFFLASAVTLLMSWHRSSATGFGSVRTFYTRRFLRIAPMYYLGALIYYYADPPASGFDLPQLLRSLTFVNAWSPAWIPTTPGWMVVPGGWSIGVEFTFYFLFPLLATYVTTLPRAVALFIVAMLLAVTMEQLGTIVFSGYGHVARDNFLYFWFFNQLPIFSLGFILYYVLLRPGVQITSSVVAYGLVAVITAVCLVAAEHPGASDRFAWNNPSPTFLIATLAFMAFIFVLARGPATLLSHRAIRRMGALSFSAYVLHFLFVANVPRWTHRFIDTGATGYAAIGNAVLLWIAVMAATALAAAVTHRFVEQPAIDLAHRLTSASRKKPSVVTAAVV